MFRYLNFKTIALGCDIFAFANVIVVQWIKNLLSNKISEFDIIVI